MAILTYSKGKNERLSKNFTVSEFACKGTGCCNDIKIDSKLVSILQSIRDHFGKPVMINSGYRCKKHNLSVGGVPSSKHTVGMAADISVQDVAPSEVARYAESIGVLGIGLYETASDGYFVHVDTRETKDFWFGQSEAYRSTFGGLVEKPVYSVDKASISLPVLKKGSQGESVRALQLLLIGYGYQCGSHKDDGKFGTDTGTALGDFQREHDLKDDEICGYDSWRALLGAE